MTPTCLESEKTKIKDPYLVFTFIFMSAHLILLYENSLMTNPQKSYCAPGMQSDMHADCHNIVIVAAKFPWNKDIRFSALCSLWAEMLQWNYSSFM